MCMRTTLSIDDSLMREVKQRAAESGRTATEMVATALRDLLRRERQAEQAHYRLRWKVVRGGAQPGVDISDRDSLYDRMDERA